MIVVKSIETYRFKIEVLQNTAGAFVVQYEDFGDESKYSSRDIWDYNQASYEFDQARLKLEGN